MPRFQPILSVLTSALLLSVLNPGAAEATLLRRSFNLNAGGSYVGNGYFDYDDALIRAVDPSDVNSNQFTEILSVVFGYTGESEQIIDDPLSQVNFDSSRSFLGVDLLLPIPSGQLDDVLIANEDAYIPSIGSTVSSSVVTYSAPTPVPTPALLPGLLAFGWSVVRRKSVPTEN